jgi:hypothetical protein
LKYIEVQREWQREALVQRTLAEEHAAYGVEARLVVQYAKWLEHQRGKETLRRHEITLSDRTRLLTDAWDEDLELLIEAKAAADRPSIRMAIGQLLDYAQALPEGTQRAVLLPVKPSANLLALLESLDIHAIWQTRAGRFSDSLGGSLST